MKVALCHPGTQHSWQTALALQQLGLLHCYFTTIFYRPERWPYRIERYLPRAASARLHAEFARFSHPGLDPALVRSAGMAEWVERLAARAGWRQLARGIDEFGNRRFDAAIAREMGSPEPFAVWGFNGSSVGAFAAARRHGRRCILDRTIGDQRVYNARMIALAASYAEWFLPLDRAIPAEQIARDAAEFEAADTILVGSPAAADTIRDCNPPGIAAKLKVLPYCYDEALFGAMPPPAPVPAHAPVRLLFVGQAGPRKGIQHLLEAMARIPAADARLTILGELRIPRAVFARYADRVDYIPSVPRAQVPAIMARHHVLVFPSYFEGSALSLLEALAAGLAIVQTRAAGLGVTPACGLMLDRPETDLLHAALVETIADRARLQHWREAAQIEARRYSFARYRTEIAKLLGGEAGLHPG